MPAVVKLTRTLAEPSLIIRWGGMPAAWRWRGRMHDLAVLHSHWEDEEGREWYRVESTGGQVFLLGRESSGWTAALRPARGERRTNRSGSGAWGVVSPA